MGQLVKETDGISASPDSYSAYTSAGTPVDGGHIFDGITDNSRRLLMRRATILISSDIETRSFRPAAVSDYADAGG
jgi:hypothetical protein